MFHLVGVGCVEDFSPSFRLMVLVSGGLEGAALPFAVVWVCGLEGAVVSLVLVVGLEGPLVSFS